MTTTSVNKDSEDRNETGTAYDIADTHQNGQTPADGGSGNKGNISQSSSLPTKSSSSELDVKHICVFKNGDIFGSGKRMVLNRRQIRTWDAFLEDLTVVLRPITGAIRDIRTPHHGTRIEGFADLIPQGNYVAVANGERLKLIDYLRIEEQNLTARKFPKRRLLEPIKPVDHSSIKIDSRINFELSKRSKAIHVFRNGDEFTRAIIIILKPKELEDMELVLRAVEDRVILPSNRAIRRLYTMDGQVVKDTTEIEDAKYYVAAAAEPFHDCSYGHELPRLVVSKVKREKHDNVRYLYQLPTPPKDKKRHHKGSDDETPAATERSHGNNEQRPKPLASDRTAKRGRPAERDRDKDKPEGTEKSKQPPKNNEDAAATKIQAVYRGYHTRQQLSPSKSPSPRRQSPATREEPKQQEPAQNRRQEPKDEQQPQRRSVVKLRPSSREDMAAARIQASYRGYRTRREIQQTKVKGTIRKPATENSRKAEESHNKEDKAAVRIQATFKGYETRKKLKEEHQTQEHAATVIQANFKGYNARKHLKEAHMLPVHSKDVSSQPNSDNEQNEAASKIQASFHGYKTRKELKQKVRKEDAAATSIQATFRGHLVRKHLHEQTEREKEAAIKIQSTFRGYEARKQVKQLHHKDEPHEEKPQKNPISDDQAATKIQAAFRGHKTRKEWHEHHVIEEHAATTIQANFRGYRTRKELKSSISPKRPEADDYSRRRNEAATVIQAGYRGFRTRRHLQDGLQT